MGDDLNMSTDHWWKHTNRVKPIALGDKLVTPSLSLPEIPHELLWDQTPAFAITGQSLSAAVMARPEKAYICITLHLLISTRKRHFTQTVDNLSTHLTTGIDQKPCTVGIHMTLD